VKLEVFNETEGEQLIIIVYHVDDHREEEEEDSQQKCIVEIIDFIQTLQILEHVMNA
jgi:hypothetical protein